MTYRLNISCVTVLYRPNLSAGSLYKKQIEQSSVNDSYFLTRQSANLMEDFVREIGRGSSLFLLYGETGVGKTSLLKRIRDRRLADTNTHWLDFGKTVTADQASSHPIDLAEKLKILAQNAESGDVIFIDHFEDSTNKAQHQLFQSWSIDGRDRKLNFIVAADSSSFDLFRQLARQFRVEARSFQLMPLDRAESEAYLRTTLFPDEPFGKLIIPRSLKKQLRACKGIFSRLVTLKERNAAGIEIDRNVGEKSSLVPVLIITLLVSVLALAGYLVYSTEMQEVRQPKENISKSTIDTLPDESEKEISSESAEEQQTTQPSQADGQLTDEESFVEAPETIAKGLEAEASDIVEEPVQTPQQETLSQIESEKPGTEIDRKDDWFQTMLDDSLRWIEDGESQRGTIQIMSIGFDQDALTAFKNYLETLQAGNIDVSQLHIFKTIANDKTIYSIVYGEYPSWSEAGLKVKTLPEILRADKPIPRTTGSISREIARIGNQTE